MVTVTKSNVFVQESLITRNVHMQYEISTANDSKVMAKVKVYG